MTEENPLYPKLEDWQKGILAHAYDTGIGQKIVDAWEAQTGQQATFGLGELTFSDWASKLPPPNKDEYEGRHPQ